MISQYDSLSFGVDETLIIIPYLLYFVQYVFERVLQNHDIFNEDNYLTNAKKFDGYISYTTSYH